MGGACALCTSERDSNGVALLLPCTRNCGRGAHAACALAAVREHVQPRAATWKASSVSNEGTCPDSDGFVPTKSLPESASVAVPINGAVDAQGRTLSQISAESAHCSKAASDEETAEKTVPNEAPTEQREGQELKIMAGDVLLHYECGCSGGLPRLFRLALAWPDAVHLALDHLTRTEKPDHEIEGLRLYHFQRICSAIAAHWALLWLQPRPAGTAWHSSVVSALSVHAGRRFFNGKTVHAERCWAMLDNLTVADLEDALAASLEPTRKRTAEILGSGLHTLSGDASQSLVGEADAQAAPRIRRGGKRVFSNLDFDRPNPGGAAAVRFSALPTHTSPQLRVTVDDAGLSRVSTIRPGGYRMARATHGIDRPGCWYFEVTLENQHSAEASADALPERRPAVRLGVSQVLAQTEAPVGFDEYGYAVRGRDCALVHCARVRPRPEAEPFASGFGPGDTVGVLIVIPDEDTSAIEPGEMSTRIASVEKMYAPLRLGDYKVRQEVHGRSSAVAFFLNGAAVPGAVFRPVYRAKYYPSVSLFGGNLSAVLNCGPTFRCMPPSLCAGDPSSSGAASPCIADVDGQSMSLPFSVRPVCDILPPQ